MAEILGSITTFEDIIDGFETMLNAMVSAMDTASTDPAIDYIYPRHSVAALRLNSATIGIGDVNLIPHGLDSGVTTRYEVEVNIRVHVAYSDNYIDQQKITRLINSIDNYVNARRDDLGEGYWIERTTEIKVPESFSESETIGGEISFLVKCVVSHTQET